jgi:hypothetical protein
MKQYEVYSQLHQKILWLNKSVLKKKDPETFFEASAYEEAQRSGWHLVELW